MRNIFLIVALFLSVFVTACGNASTPNLTAPSASESSNVSEHMHDNDDAHTHDEQPSEVETDDHEHEAGEPPHRH